MANEWVLFLLAGGASRKGEDVVSKGAAQAVTREEFDNLRALVDQNSRGLARLMDIVGNLNSKTDNGFSAIREEMHAMSEALREEIQAGNEALKDEMQRRFTDQGARIESLKASVETLNDRVETLDGRVELITSEQQLIRKEFSRMTTAWTRVDEAVRIAARNEGREAAWEWIAFTDDKLHNVEGRLTRLGAARDQGRST